MNEDGQISELIQACKQNQSYAQLKIYNMYCKAMYNTALRITNNPDDAEDVMQNAFIKAFTKLDKFQYKSTFGAWLKRIVINEAISWLRKQKKFQHVSMDENIQKIAETQADNLPKNTDVKKILKAVSNLKENYRIVFSLYYIEGYDYDEITRILNISYANARAILSRAKQKIRQELQQEQKI